MTKTMVLGDLNTKARLILSKGVETDDFFDPPVVFDTGAVPDDIDSYKAAYDELALGYSTEGYMSLVNFVDMLERANGGTFTGYKGGEYMMHSNTPVWISNYGSSEGIIVADIKLIEGRVVILTDQESR